MLTIIFEHTYALPTTFSNWRLFRSGTGHDLGRLIATRSEAIVNVAFVVMLVLMNTQEIEIPVAHTGLLFTTSISPAWAYLPLGHLGNGPLLWALDRKCSKLKIKSHTLTSSVSHPRWQNRGGTKTVFHMSIKQWRSSLSHKPFSLLCSRFPGVYSLTQLNECSTASQEHDPTGSVSNNCSTIDIPKQHVLEYRRCCETSFHCSS